MFLLKKYLAIIIGCFVLLVAGSIPVQALEDVILNDPPSRPAQPASLFSAVDSDYLLYLPFTLSPEPPGPWVDIGSRDAVKALYQAEYLGSADSNFGWTGNQASCDPGTTLPSLRENILRRINYFRSMAGVPPVLGFNDTYNAKAQAAALIMSANNALSHFPDASWKCFTADGQEAASSSNLSLGRSGPTTISSGYMYDPGGSNYPVGHRRWILYPQTQYMGTGDIPSGNGYSASNALWVFDNDNIWGPRPETREDYVAWPPPGYVPYQVVYPRWSFAYDDADFDQASVTMTMAGSPLALTVNPTEYGFGENTLVWEPQTTFGTAPASDTSYTVTIHGVNIDNVLTDFTYTVIVFDPDK